MSHPRIDKRLHLIIPVIRGDGTEIFVHSAPIGSDVFDKYYLPIARTFAAMYTQGLGVMAGPRVADKLLRQVAQEQGVWEGADGVQNGLMAEIHRLTNVLIPGGRGWEIVPYYDATSKGQIDKADAAEIEAAIVFFTVASAMHRRKELVEVLDGATSLWGAQAKYLTCTEFKTSLQTSTESENSGEKGTSSETSSNGSQDLGSRNSPTKVASSGSRPHTSGSAS